MRRGNPVEPGYTERLLRGVLADVEHAGKKLAEEVVALRTERDALKAENEQLKKDKTRV